MTLGISATITEILRSCRFPALAMQIRWSRETLGERLRRVEDLVIVVVVVVVLDTRRGENAAVN